VAHPIWLARLDKTRPVLLLTREEVRAVRHLVTIAPITSTARGLSSEVSVGVANGLDQDSVVNLDLITTVPRERLIRPLGTLLDNQEPTLTRAFHAAFELED
jgi:mRNA interferase MazF